LSPLQQLPKARLYLVLGPENTRGRSLLRVAERALRGGVDILQLRDYSLRDAALLDLARRLRALTRKHRALFIVNNRPDIARLSGADGVHVGQEDLSVRQARVFLGNGKLVGVSTHRLSEAKKALRDGADYIGIGPVYATPTKAGRIPAGLGYVRQAAGLEIPIPWFAIGGIDASNLGAALSAGASRVAVVRAIAGAPRPGMAAAELKRILEKTPPP
jgi:thiamine-phosphate pyrophosphorylase